jgi:hypothetical protein
MMKNLLDVPKSYGRSKVGRCPGGKLSIVRQDIETLIPETKTFLDVPKSANWRTFESRGVKHTIGF